MSVGNLSENLEDARVNALIQETRAALNVLDGMREDAVGPERRTLDAARALVCARHSVYIRYKEAMYRARQAMRRVGWEIS